MDDLLAVGRLQRRPDLADDAGGLVQRQRASGQPLGQVLALEIFQHQVRGAVREQVEIEDVDDVGVAQAGGNFGLAAEPDQALVVAGNLGM